MRLYEYQAKELFCQAGILPENYRFAVVSTAAAYGMGRMVQILSEAMHIEVEVFTNIDEARRWLTGEIALPRK